MPNKVVSGGPRPARARTASAELSPLGQQKRGTIPVEGNTERIYAVELFYESPPDFTKSGLCTSLARRFPHIKPLSEDSSDLLAFVHEDCMVQYKGGALPAQLLVVPGQREGDSVSIEPALEQSWLFPDAREAVSIAKHTVLVNDIMAQGLPYRERLDRFLGALEAILTDYPCRAIHWRQSQQVMSCEQFLSSMKDPQQHTLNGGPLNGRFFNVSNGQIEGECLVDTMGLAVFGLPDIQCHFHGLDVDSVIHQILNVAIYLFDNGDLIEDGNTVPGLQSGEKWTCQHEDSLAPPNRVVLDLNPGAQWAAGKRA